VVSLTERTIQHQLKGKNMSKSEKKQDASIVWFEIPADDPERAKLFYSNLFGWKINPFPGSGDYSHIDTGGADDTPDGALKRRQRPEEPIVNYVRVTSVDKFADKIAKLGGKSAWPKRRCHRWVTLLSARTLRVTPLDSGRAMRRQNNCPNQVGRLVVSVTKRN